MTYTDPYEIASDVLYRNYDMTDEDRKRVLTELRSFPEYSDVDDSISDEVMCRDLIDIRWSEFVL